MKKNREIELAMKDFIAFCEIHHRVISAHRIKIGANSELINFVNEKIHPSHKSVASDLVVL